jgi:predicted nuclease of predicted toxin-antitoxin system
VKFLLDENISRRIVPALQARFPGTSQVALLGLERSTDRELCDFAARAGYVICSKDEDFVGLVTALRYQPKLVQIALGNASNDQILHALLRSADHIENALEQQDVGIVVVE